MRGLSTIAQTWGASVFCLFLLAPHAAAQSFSCATQVTDQVGLRARASSELVAPVVVRCSGTKPAGGIVGAIHINLNVPLASRTLDSAINANEALLLIDNPAPGAQVARAVDMIVPNANVIQGFYNSGSIIWQTLEIAPAGPAGPFVREFRIVNVRANVSQLATPATVTMTVNLLTNPFVPFTGSQANVGTVITAGGVSARTMDDFGDYTQVIDGCVGNRPVVAADTFRDFNVRFGEGNANEFRRRNVATSANASSAVANQNDPFTSYGTETGFFNSAFPPVNSMNLAGLATNGTRLMARFTGVPSGVTVFVTTGSVPEGTISSNIVARLTTTDANGSGPYSPIPASVGTYAQVPVVNGVATAVWEILESNPDSLELISFGVILSVPANTSTFGKISLQGGLAPLASGNNASTAPLFATLPPGREIAEIRTCATLLTVATSCPLNSASIGQPYNLLVAASGGTPPYGWTLVGGALPEGIQLNTNGLISGSPQVTGAFNFIFKVTDFFGATAFKECSLLVSTTLTINTACPLPDATVGVAYSQLLAVQGGQPGYLWTISQGSLPPGVGLSPNGVVNGVPSVAGTYDFTLRVQDGLLFATEKPCQLRAGGPFRVFPSELSFRGNAGGGLPPPQTLNVSSSNAGQSFSVRVNTDDGSPWLRATPSTGTLPASVEVTADPRSLAPGQYSGTVIVAALNLAQQSLSARVSLRVDPAAPPSITVEPSGISLAVPRSSGAVRRSIQVLNAGGGLASYSASVTPLDGAGWITAAPASGSATPEAPGVVRLEMNTGALEPGVHRARLTLTSSSTNQTLQVPVTLAVSAGRDLMEVSHSGLTFTAVNGGPAPATQNLTIQSSGAGGFSWDAATIIEGASTSWLALTQSAGSVTAGNPSTIGVRANAGGLAPGQYFGEIRLRASGIENSPRTVLVALRVLASGTNPGLAIAPGGITFTARQGELNVPPQTVQVFNPLPQASNFEYSFPPDNRIFTATTPDGKTATSGSPVRIQVAANVAGLGAGIYRFPLTVYGSNDPRVQSIDVAVVVLPSSSASVQEPPAELRGNFTCTTGSGLAMVSRTLGSGFSTLSGLAVPLDLQITDRTGQPLRTGSVNMVPSLEESSTVALHHLGNGRWTATWTPNAPSGGPVTLSYFAEDVDRGVSGCVQASGVIEANPTGPYLPPNGVVSTASFQAYEPVAHGSLLAIFGSKLAATPVSASSLPLPFQLGGTRVSLGGIDMPMFYAGETNGLSQVNAQAPYTLPGGVSLPLVVRTANGWAMSEVIVAETQPGIFTSNQSGQGQGIIVLGSNPNALANAANPAARGEVVVIYCSGLGRTQPAVNAGSAAPSSPPAEAAVPVSVTIGGRPATVQFSGLTPGLVGLYQINVVVPPDSATGNAVPVVVSTGGAVSANVTMAVK